LRKKDVTLLKKIGVLLLALVLFVSLAACAQTTDSNLIDDEPYIQGAETPDVEPDTPEPIEDTQDAQTLAFETYSHIMQRLSLDQGQESGAYDIDFVAQTEMRLLGEEISSTSSGNIRMIVDGDRMETAMVMHTDMGALGTSEMEMYMALEGTELTTMQMLIDGEELPLDLPPGAFEDMFDEMLDGAMNMPDFQMEALQTVEIEETDDYTVIHMVLDGQMLADFVMDSMDSMLNNLDELNMSLHLVIEDIYMTIVTDSVGTPLTMDMDMVMQMEFDLGDLELPEGLDLNMGIHMIVEYTFNAFGEAVEIELFV